jgi:uncharacterized membrane protein (UPF0127 family)
MFEIAAIVAALGSATVCAPAGALHLQVASTPAQREHGLMGVKHLAPHTGMIFVFDADEPVAFWMKDTLISLDMVFLAPDGTVRKVFRSVPVVSPSLPDERIPLEQGTAKYVIELAAGEAEKDGLRPGARVKNLP